MKEASAESSRGREAGYFVIENMLDRGINLCRTLKEASRRVAEFTPSRPMREPEAIKVILQVDDSADDVLLLRYAFERAGIGEHLRAVSSGALGLRYLEGEGEFADRREFPVPCLVLLDVNMLGMDGFDVLARIRADPQFRNLPVSMYSSSLLEADIERAVRRGADSYVEKPVTLQAELEFARNIAITWFSSRPRQQGGPRILLRKRVEPRHGREAGFYLQPGGGWGKNRGTARQFAHTVDACWWAQEQEYLDAEIILAYAEPGRDYSCMRT